MVTEFNESFCASKPVIADTSTLIYSEPSTTPLVGLTEATVAGAPRWFIISVNGTGLSIVPTRKVLLSLSKLTTWILLLDTSPPNTFE